MPDSLLLSSLNKTWIIDLDGTLVKHNGYKLDGKDSFLPDALAFMRNLPPDDMVLFLTSRPVELAESTERFLDDNGIRFNHIIYNAPYGERILINDQKPSGLNCAYAINVKRDSGLGDIKIEIDDNL